MKWDHPIAYEQGVNRWFQTDGNEGIEPIGADLEGDLSAIRIARELGIPVTKLQDIPGHWIGSATVLFEVERLQHEKAMKRSRRQRSASAPQRRSGPRG